LSRSGGSGPSGIVKAEGAHFSRGDYTSTGRTGNRDFIPDPQYPYEDIDAPRVDIELINLISDDSDDDPVITGVRKVPTGRGKSTSKGGLKPVRLHRQEHKERVTLVNTEPTIKIQSDSEEESPVIDELQSSRAPVKEKDFKGTYQDVEDTRIKAEPDTAEHGVPMAMPFHGIPPTPEPQIPIKEGTYSPESKRKTKDQVTSSAIDLDVQEDDAAASGQKHRKGRRPSKKKDKKPVIQTEEDRAEYERHMEDVAILANELGGLQGNLGGPPREANGDVPMVDVEVRDKKEGRLYLFQFPPVLPELYNPLNEKPKSKAEIKREKNAEKATKADEDVQMSGMSAKAKGKMKEKVDLTGDATVKVEEEVELGPDGKPKKEEDKRRREEVVHEEGWIGKLVVRESGKVELCWGGTNLAVGRGVDAGFLTTGVMVDMIEKGPPGGGPPEGKALSMGQIMGKFVVTPDWEKMV
jgi:DNA-directed RNA polymerase III subunit RPC4